MSPPGARERADVLPTAATPGSPRDCREADHARGVLGTSAATGLPLYPLTGLKTPALVEDSPAYSESEGEDPEDELKDSSEGEDTEDEVGDWAEVEGGQ